MFMESNDSRRDTISSFISNNIHFLILNFGFKWQRVSKT